jgi:hypothetical protein
MIYQIDQLTPGVLKGPFPIIVEDESRLGKIYKADDLHNVEVVFDGTGILIEMNGEEIECGGSGLYCLVSDCDEDKFKS